MAALNCHMDGLPGPSPPDQMASPSAAGQRGHRKRSRLGGDGFTSVDVPHALLRRGSAVVAVRAGWFGALREVVVQRWRGAGRVGWRWPGNLGATSSLTGVVWGLAAVKRVRVIDGRHTLPSGRGVTGNSSRANTAPPAEVRSLGGGVYSCLDVCLFTYCLFTARPK